MGEWPTTRAGTIVCLGWWIRTGMGSLKPAPSLVLGSTSRLTAPWPVCWISVVMFGSPTSLTFGVCGMPTETASPKNEKSCTRASVFEPHCGGMTCTAWCWVPMDACTGRLVTGDTTSSMAKATSMFRRIPVPRSVVNWTVLVWRCSTTDCATRKSLRLTITATCSPATTTPTVATKRGWCIWSKVAKPVGTCATKPSKEKTAEVLGTKKAYGNRVTMGNLLGRCRP